MEPSYPRTFICIPLSDQIRKNLADIHQHIRHVAPQLSVPHADDAHITLVFLGEVPAAIAGGLGERLDDICARVAPFQLPVEGGGFFGRAGRPNIIWAGVKPPPVLLDLRQAIAQMVERSGFTLETRPFRPHVTVARIRTALPSPALTSIITCINNTHFAEIPVDRVLFMNSLLNGSGPRYTTIHRSLLKGH